MMAMMRWFNRRVEFLFTLTGMFANEQEVLRVFCVANEVAILIHLTTEESMLRLAFPLRSPVPTQYTNPLWKIWHNPLRHSYDTLTAHITIDKASPPLPR